MSYISIVICGVCAHERVCGYMYTFFVHVQVLYYGRICIVQVCQVREMCECMCVCVCLYLAVSYFDSSSFDAAASKKMKGKIISFDASQTIYISTGLH